VRYDNILICARYMAEQITIKFWLTIGRSCILSKHRKMYSDRSSLGGILVALFIRCGKHPLESDEAEQDTSAGSIGRRIQGSRYLTVRTCGL